MIGITRCYRTTSSAALPVLSKQGTQKEDVAIDIGESRPWPPPPPLKPYGRGGGMTGRKEIHAAYKAVWSLPGIL